MQWHTSAPVAVIITLGTVLTSKKKYSPPRFSAKESNCGGRQLAQDKVRKKDDTLKSFCPA